jgi:hypothetical protein
MEGQIQSKLVSISKIESPNKSGWFKLEGTYPEDEIYCRRSATAVLRHSEMSIQSAEHITWWKGIELVRNDNGAILRDCYTQDHNHGPNDFDFGITSFDSFHNYTAYLCKAKEFGIHTRMYHMAGEDIFAKLEFYWQKD